MPLRDHLIATAVLGYAAMIILLAAAGVPLDKDATGLKGEWNDFRFSLRDTFRPAQRTLGISQRWKMFRKVSRNTGRIEIAVQIDGRWEDIFVERQEPDWRRGTFEHHRWREFANHLRGEKKRDQWKLYVPWASERAFADHPEATAVRFRVMGARIPKPETLADRGALRFDAFRKETIVER
ncbi:MAG: hypothetical protein GY898_17640 [Proteobacteria bacterium]|nr:hypothetical protein [Pseudomonadota bacterium]